MNTLTTHADGPCAGPIAATPPWPQSFSAQEKLPRTP